MIALRRYRPYALLCSLAYLLSEFISWPRVEMGVVDDWAYISVAHHLAETGHIVYNGWISPVIGWQLYLGAACIKLLGFSFSAVRLGDLFVGTLTAFVLQRTLVRAGISEQNATFGTLAFVLSPLFMMLSSSFMTDVPGIFGLLVCLYACLRALGSPTDRSATKWVCLAVLLNVVFGSARQIAWLGTLVMVPSTLFCLYTERRLGRRLLLTAASAMALGWIVIFAILQWFTHQPYIIPEHLIPKTFPLAAMRWEFSQAFLDMPFLLLPVAVLFFAAFRTASRRGLTFVGVATFLYLLPVYHWRHLVPNPMLEPTKTDWVSVFGVYMYPFIKGQLPTFLYPSMQVALTIAAIGGLFGLGTLWFSAHKPAQADAPEPARLTSKQLTCLLGPYCAAYLLTLIDRATQTIYDRYLLPLLLLSLIYALRLYQQRIQRRVPAVAWGGVALFAAYGIISTHNLYALYRARLVLAAEIRSAGFPDTAVDNGWEYNGYVELQHAPAVNLSHLTRPVGFYTPMPERPDTPCSMVNNEQYAHLSPRVAVSFDPNLCLGPTGIPPVTYTRWPGLAPGHLYVVNVTPPPPHLPTPQKP